MTAKLLGHIHLRGLPTGLVAALLGIVMGPHTGIAQGTFRGRVVDSETGRSVGKATVAIHGQSEKLTTDKDGLFTATIEKGNEVEVTIEALGYQKATFRETLTDAVHILALDFTGYKLPEIVIEGRIEELAPRYAQFEQRRERGIGTFLRWDDLIKKGSNSLDDALRTVRGVKVQCNQQTFECHAVMARSLTCQPTWWVDGVQVHSFSEDTPLRDVYGVEIYRGPGEVPGEFAGSDAACGVIVVWTKSRPYRYNP
jgi:hypothetical protein